MKKAIIALCTVAFLGAAAPALAGKIGSLQKTHQARIHSGAASGQLTAAEVKALEKQQVRIQKSKTRALADGKMDKYERARILALQDQATDRIWALKHNQAKRW